MKTGVLITGAGSFIAKKVAAGLTTDGYYIIGTSSSKSNIDNYNKIYHLKLGESFSEILERENVIFLIHCAFDKNENKINEIGTLRWAKQAKKAKVKHQIFLSSVSAFKEAVSEYGQSKYNIEKWFIENNYTVLRLGLVFGKGGVFNNLLNFVKKYPFFPLIDKGNTRTFISDVDTVAKVIIKITEAKGKGSQGVILNLQQSESVNFKEIILEIRKQLKTFSVLIPVPFLPLFYLVKLFGHLRLNIGFNSNNLVGMRQNNDLNIKSDLRNLGYNELKLEQLIHKYLQG